MENAVYLINETLLYPTAYSATVADLNDQPLTQDIPQVYAQTQCTLCPI